MSTLDLAKQLRRIAAEVERIDAAAVHWIDAFAAGDVVGSETAAAILDVSPVTARRRAAERANGKNPIAVYVGGTWLFSVSRVLDDAERDGGLPARLAAKSRAEKLAHLIAPNQKPAPDARLRSA